MGTKIEDSLCSDILGSFSYFFRSFISCNQRRDDVYFSVNREYFMESAGVRYSCTHDLFVSEIEQVRFLILNNEDVNTVLSTFVVLFLLYSF